MTDTEHSTPARPQAPKVTKTGDGFVACDDCQHPMTIAGTVCGRCGSDFPKFIVTLHSPYTATTHCLRCANEELVESSTRLELKHHG